MNLGINWDIIPELSLKAEGNIYLYDYRYESFDKKFKIQTAALPDIDPTNPLATTLTLAAPPIVEPIKAFEKSLKKSAIPASVIKAANIIKTKTYCITEPTGIPKIPSVDKNPKSATSLKENPECKKGYGKYLPKIVYNSNINDIITKEYPMVRLVASKTRLINMSANTI